MMTTTKEDITQFSLELLSEHNRLRNRYGTVGDLELDKELSKKAQAHADSLAARQCKLENSTDETVGENLYYLESEDGKYTAQHIVEYWLKRSNFDSHTRPKTTNHFTQIVWKASKKIGVGVARAANGAVYVAAFYFPRGNVVNYLDENVLMKEEEEVVIEKVNNTANTDAASSSDNQNGSGDDSPKHNVTISIIKINHPFYITFNFGCFNRAMEATVRIRTAKTARQKRRNSRTKR